MRILHLFVICLLFASCQNKKERDIASARPNYSNHNWTGEYTFSDGENIHDLKLLRGRVDADYQVSYSTSANNFGGSIWRLKDFNDSIQVYFTNNFSENATNVPFKRGDLLFSMHRNKAGEISTKWYTLQPTNTGNFTLVSTDLKPN